MKRLAAKNHAVGDRVVYMHGHAEEYFLIEGTIVLRNGRAFVKVDNSRTYCDSLLRGTKLELTVPEFVEWHENFIKM